MAAVSMVDASGTVDCAVSCVSAKLPLFCLRAHYGATVCYMPLQAETISSCIDSMTGMPAW